MRKALVLAVALAVMLGCAAYADQTLQELLSPLGINNRALGGAYSESGLYIWDYTAYNSPGDGIDGQWTKAAGASNNGLLIKTWGTVKNTFYSPTTGAKWFHIDDGSRVTSDLTDTGVIVYSDADVKIGQYVAVTGISGTEPAIDMPDKLVRVLRTRSAEDVQVLKEPVALYPFSDEFDKEKLDWRWFWPDFPPFIPGGEVSVSAGCLKLSLSADNVLSYQPFVTQNGAGGDWDLALKLRLEPAQDPARQGIVVSMQYPGATRGPADTEGDAYIHHLAAVYTTTQTPSAPFHVSVAGRRDFLSGTSDTWYFSIRKRGNMLFGSASPDGVSFSDEASSSCAAYPCFYIYAYSFSFESVMHPVCGYVDYFRITPVSE